jgi:hypothetical protein
MDCREKHENRGDRHPGRYDRFPPETPITDLVLL